MLASRPRSPRPTALSPSRKATRRWPASCPRPRRICAEPLPAPVDGFRTRPARSSHSRSWRRAKREEVWIAERAAAGLKALWWDVAGARDADGETALVVKASDQGIEEYQTAARLSRCDGAPVPLFRRTWDFASHNFRATRPSFHPRGHTLQARRGDAPKANQREGFFFSPPPAHPAPLAMPPSYAPRGGQRWQPRHRVDDRGQRSRPDPDRPVERRFPHHRAAPLAGRYEQREGLPKQRETAPFESDFQPRILSQNVDVDW
jgi:hypothetical protein